VTPSSPDRSPEGIVRAVAGVLVGALGVLFDVSRTPDGRLAAVRDRLAEAALLLEEEAPAAQGTAPRPWTPERAAFDVGRWHVRNCADTGADPWYTARHLFDAYDRDERHGLLDGILAEFAELDEEAAGPAPAVPAPVATCPAVALPASGYLSAGHVEAAWSVVLDEARQEAEQRLGVDAGDMAVVGDPVYAQVLAAWSAWTASDGRPCPDCGGKQTRAERGSPWFHAATGDQGCPAVRPVDGTGTDR